MESCWQAEGNRDDGYQEESGRGVGKRSRDAI